METMDSKGHHGCPQLLPCNKATIDFAKFVGSPGGEEREEREVEEHHQILEWNQKISFNKNNTLPKTNMAPENQ